MADVGMKVCRKCLCEKPITEFTITDRQSGARRAWCKPCMAERVRAYYATNEQYRTKQQENIRSWAKANPRSKSARRRYALKAMYDLTPAQYEDLLAAQKRRCALCGSDDPGRKSGKWSDGHFCVDHDHSDGRVRGLLCNRCNAALGMYEWLRDKIGEAAVLEYLTRQSPVMPVPVVAPEYRRVEAAPPRYVRGQCSIEGCDKPHQARGYCEMHYMRFVRTGDAGPAEELPHQTPRGSAHPKSKLSEADVLAIRASDETGAALAERFGVTRTLISNVRNRKVWQHV